MIEVEEAQARILERVRPCAVEKRAAAEARGLYLAEDVAATFPLPPFDNSAMDGYGVRVGDVARPPTVLKLVAESRAGVPVERPLGLGEAMRVLTGAPIPPGVEAIVRQEDVERSGAEVRVLVSVSAGKDIRRRGGDVREGDLVLRAGARIGVGETFLLAALGVTDVLVHRRPRIAILSTGDELVEPGRPLGPGQIYASNGAALAALVDDAGGEVLALGIAPDDEASIAARIDEARGADLLLTSGGVSVGDYDLVRRALDRLGWRSEFWKVRMKPGKPVAFGVLGEMPVLGLPGNPVSSMVGFEVFARPALLEMLGDPSPVPTPLPATLGVPYRKDDGRRHYLRCRTEWRAGGGIVLHPHFRQGSSMITSMTGVDSLGIVDGPAGPRAEGTEILRLSLPVAGVAR